MSTSSMLHARNNVSPALAESPILRWPEVCQAGHRTNRMHAGSAVFKTPSEAGVLVPGKQHKWKDAQEVRNGSRLCENVHEQRMRRIVFSLSSFDGGCQSGSF